MMANALGLDVSELGGAEDPEQMQTISSMCTVFAESEIIGSLAARQPQGRDYSRSAPIGRKKSSSYGTTYGNQRTSGFHRGVAINPGVKRALEEEIGLEVMVPEACQYTGALGAALLALESG